MNTTETTATISSIIATATTNHHPTTTSSSHDGTVVGEKQHELFVSAILMLTLILISMNLNGLLHKLKVHALSETAGGYTLQRVSFFSNILTILALAFAGALYSCFITSIFMYVASMIVYKNPWSFIEALVFGSLISSTDPVTVLSLLPSNVDRRLYMLIFGESALNDAVAIILYKFFTGIQDQAASKIPPGIGSIILSIIKSATVFFGSFGVGSSVALIFAKITKHVNMEQGSTYEMLMLIIFAYISYLLADVIQLTGIISIFFCGITMAHYAAGNISEEARVSVKVAILVSRTHVFIICGIKNFLTKGSAEPEIPLNQQTLVWFSGLRGAVAFALGVTFLEHPLFDQDVKAQIFGTTVMVVVLSVLVIGGLTPHMLVWLKISDEEEHHSEEKQTDEEELLKRAEKTPLYQWLQSIDERYIRHHFSNQTVDTFAPKVLFPKTVLAPESRQSRTSLSYKVLPKELESGDLGLATEKETFNIE